MSIENFIWDKQNQCVSWNYNGKTIKKIYENMNFANFDLQNNYVLVTVGKNFRVEQVYYLSFEGKQIFLFDKVNGEISWQYNNQLIGVSCENIQDAQIYFKNDIVIAITAINQIDKKMKGFSLDGKLIFEKESPAGYIFEYLSTSNKLPTVVCDGGKANADAYGRSEFHFEIDTKTGDMSKICLAY